MAINVVYAMTRNIYHKILPSLRSLAEHHPDAVVYILAEDDKLPFDTPIKCNVINVSGQKYFTKRNCVNIGNRFGGYINLLKVLYPTILPDIDKVMHLDIDTVICDSLDEFWDMDLTGKWFASVPEYLARHGREKMFGDVYYNMGVSLINLKQMRDDNIETVMADYLRDVEQPFADQDAWNKCGIEQDKIAVALLRFNENMSTGYTDNPAIVHYCGIDDWYENKSIYRRKYLDAYLTHRRMYMVHTCNDRAWYVREYLVPSLIESGIDKDDIIVWNDENGIGNLASFVASCRWISENLEPYDDTWHLQDDVCISSRFFAETQKNYLGIANGFCNEIFDAERTNYIGEITGNGMWFSFQCIMIPNRLADLFVKWFDSGEAERLFPEYVSSGKCDDSLFREYVMRYEPKISAMNVFPNIADHVDYLIGGTTINKQRLGQKRVSYWRDKALDEAVAELERKLTEDGRGICDGTDTADCVSQST